MKITGNFEKDNNFIFVYCDNSIFTIAKNTGVASQLRAGEKTVNGTMFTKKDFQRMEAACEKSGTFNAFIR